MRPLFYMPFWEDRLDPHYDFINDKASPERKKKSIAAHDKLAHELMSSSPYDGILISIATFLKKVRLKKDNNGNITLSGYSNIKDYLHIPEKSGLKVLGDCGAFSYVGEPEPPEFFNIENVSKIYEKLGFDFGVSVDHLIVRQIFERDDSGKKVSRQLRPEEQKQRLRITRKNVKEFYNYHEKHDLSFTPIASIQGWNEKTYLTSVRQAIEIGYEYVAIGGLVQYKTPYIIKILKKIRTEFPKIKIHVFGVQRLDLLPVFKELNITSFDSASFFRKAWLRSGQNYYSNGKGWYTAIRVPYSWYWSTKKAAAQKNIPASTLEKLEKAALDALRKYDKGIIDLDTALEHIMRYDSLFIRSSEAKTRFRERYKKTLEDKPWSACSCDFCKKLGIDIVIFRGTNRNKRRGFHNVWNFYKSLK